MAGHWGWHDSPGLWGRVHWHRREGLAYEFPGGFLAILQRPVRHRRGEAGVCQLHCPLHGLVLLGADVAHMGIQLRSRRHAEACHSVCHSLSWVHSLQKITPL